MTAWTRYRSSLVRFSHALGLVRVVAIMILAVAFYVGWNRDDGRRGSITEIELSSDSPQSHDSRLLNGIERRRNWPSNTVKIWLANPTISTTLMRSDGRHVVVHAWGRHENDYNTAMMRLDSCDLLYAITEAEFVALRSLTSAPSQ